MVRLRFSLTTVQRWFAGNLLLPVVVCYILGGTAARYFLPNPAGLLFTDLAGLMMLALLFLFRRRRLALYLVPAVFILIGFARTGQGLLPPGNPAAIANLLTTRSRVTLTGTLLRMPEYNGRITRLIIAVDSVLFRRPRAGGTPSPVPARGRVSLSLHGRPEDTIRPGDRLLVIAVINRTYNYQTPGAFDYRLYLAERDIFVTGRIPEPADIMVFREPENPWFRRLRFLPERLRQHITAFLDSHLEPEAAGLYRALLVGSRSGISAKTLAHFKATGCMHLLAISGIHMALLGLMITLSLTWLMKRSTTLLLHIHVPTVATLLALPPLVGYALIAGMNTPVIRALLMAVLFLFAVALRRQRSLVHIVAAAALILLLCKPQALFSVSFQLSFAAVLAITLVYPRLLAILDGGETTAAKETPRRNKLYRYVLAAFMVSVAATLGALPFLLYYFNRFSTIGPVINLLVEPLLCFWALPIGLLATPLIFFAPGTAAILFRVGALGITAADKVTLLGSRLPFASCRTITPTSMEIILYYAILCLWLAAHKKKGATLILLAPALVLVVSFTHGLWLPHSGRTTTVSFLDVGQGSSTLMQLPGGKTVLLDGGSTTSENFDIGERVIAPFLWKKRLWHLTDLVISHPHSDHYNGMGFILRHFRPARLWINGDRDEAWTYRKILRTAARQGVKIIVPRPGQRLASAAATKLVCLGMTRTDAHNRSGPAIPPPGVSVNDQSLVLRLSAGAYAFLFPGDISKTAEKKLLDQHRELRADILLAPHHGSKTSGSRAFISAVNPKIIIVSAGHRGRGRYPDPAHLKRWRRENRIVLETAKVGTVTCITDGKKLEVKTWRGKWRPGPVILR
ncbi:MAG: DNA internalization-related competence protein ComEC/Rec2 [Deltaproteobacteria bacterium]|nr:DNA internalization-related competence protein ComEC/Rec2 [Deltaproteobacteria bacterium]